MYHLRLLPSAMLHQRIRPPLHTKKQMCKAVYTHELIHRILTRLSGNTNKCYGEGKENQHDDQRDNHPELVLHSR